MPRQLTPAHLPPGHPDPDLLRRPEPGHRPTVYWLLLVTVVLAFSLAFQARCSVESGVQ